MTRAYLLAFQAASCRKSFVFISRIYCRRLLSISTTGGHSPPWEQQQRRQQLNGSQSSSQRKGKGKAGCERTQHVLHALTSTLAIKDVNERLVRCTHTLQALPRGTQRSADVALFLAKMAVSVCNDSVSFNRIAMAKMAALLPLLSVREKVDGSRVSSAVEEEIFASLCTYVESSLWLVVRRPPLLWESEDLTSLVAIMQAVCYYPPPLVMALRATCGHLHDCVRASKSRNSLLDLVRLLTPGERLPAEPSRAAMLLMQTTLSQLVTLMRAPDSCNGTSPWAIEQDVRFSSACRSVTLHRLKHEAFLEATVACLQARSLEYQRASTKLRLRLGVVANIVYLVSFMCVAEAVSSVVRSLVSSTPVPPGCVSFSTDADGNIVTGRTPLQLAASQRCCNVLDVLQLYWSCLVPHFQFIPLHLRIVFNNIIVNLKTNRRQWSVCLAFLALQCFSPDDTRLHMPLYLCRSCTWYFPPALASWLHIVRDLDDSDDGAEASRVCTLGLRPGGLIAGYSVVSGKPGSRLQRPDFSFDDIIDTLGRYIESASSQPVSYGSAFRDWDRPQADIGGSALRVALLLVPDEHVLRIAAWEQVRAGRGERATNVPGQCSTGWLPGSSRSSSGPRSGHIYSTAVSMQVGILQSLDYAVAVLSVSDVLHWEKRGQRPRDTCLIAMATEVRRVLRAQESDKPAGSPEDVSHIAHIQLSPLL